ncbi:hypothetical protein VTK73DRAFT_1303 [Phialemonium thermophilum]|uniref:Uncharacterized protein n=1 Tax=Phialemonium thermophilum TaxID=223376 RepID=A0ABR3XA24_9PEZI
MSEDTLPRNFDAISSYTYGPLPKRMTLRWRKPGPFTLAVIIKVNEKPIGLDMLKEEGSVVVDKGDIVYILMMEIKFEEE